MKLARYAGGGRIEICDEPMPELPKGGLVVRTEASGLCSGELMDWYMERKVPHVLGHEVAGIVERSDDPRFPAGARVAPHHHASCGECSSCRSGREVHCRQWKETKLDPGGMAEKFAVAPENLSDTWTADDLRPQDAALMEPLACVAKSLRAASISAGERVAIVGLGTMGLMHALVLGSQAMGIEINPSRLRWASDRGVEARETGERAFDAVVVCPGSQAALSSAFELVLPGGRVVLFAPFPQDESVRLPWDRLYFEEISLVPSYSCGPTDTVQALEWLRAGRIRAEQVVSDFIGMSELPAAYEAMKRGEILKAMVMFP
jgi:L-iditol 2-dehydrogenase